MPTIAINPELYKRMEKMALEHNANIDDILNRAIQRELDRLDRDKQTLEQAAANGSRQTFHKTVTAIDWTSASAEQFILAIGLSLELGDITTAIKLSAQGLQKYPDDFNLQRATQVLAPANITGDKQPYIEGLTATLEWFTQNATEYRGYWVAVKQGKLLGKATSRQNLALLLDKQDSTADVLVVQVP